MVLGTASEMLAARDIGPDEKALQHRLRTASITLAAREDHQRLMFDDLKLLLKAKTAASEINDIRKEIDTMDPKSLLASKTFWMNLLGLGITLSGILPQKWGMPLLAVANIGMRLISNQPVNIFPDKTQK